MKHKYFLTEELYEKAADRIEQLAEALPKTPEAKELKQLTKAIGKYERNKHLSENHYTWSSL